MKAILSHLEGVKRSGSRYQACCPCHDDTNPSLSLEEKAGKALFEAKEALCRLAEQTRDWEPTDLVTTMSYEHLTPTEILDEAGFGQLREEPKGLEDALRNLEGISASLDRIKRELVRSEALKQLQQLKIPGASRLVNAAFSAAKESRKGSGETQGKAVVFEELEPWPEPVEGKALIDDLLALVERFLVTDQRSRLAMALFVVFTYVYQSFDVCPILAFISALKRCGKTRAMGLLSCLVCRPLSASNVTPATLFRSVEKYRPTLLIDEADSFLKGNEELRGILNSGHHRAMGFILRSAGDDHEPRQFNTFHRK